MRRRIVTTVFANRAASGLARGLKVARVKSKEAVSVVNTQRHMAQVQSERKAAVQELGETMVRMLDNGSLNESAPVAARRNRRATAEEGRRAVGGTRADVRRAERDGRGARGAAQAATPSVGNTTVITGLGIEWRSTHAKRGETRSSTCFATSHSSTAF
jgi:hypothetical protein